MSSACIPLLLSFSLSCWPRQQHFAGDERSHFPDVSARRMHKKNIASLSLEVLLNLRKLHFGLMQTRDLLIATRQIAGREEAGDEIFLNGRIGELSAGFQYLQFPDRKSV